MAPSWWDAIDPVVRNLENEELHIGRLASKAMGIYALRQEIKLHELDLDGYTFREGCDFSSLDSLVERSNGRMVEQKTSHDRRTQTTYVWDDAVLCIIHDRWNRGEDVYVNVKTFNEEFLSAMAKDLKDIFHHRGTKGHAYIISSHAGELRLSSIGMGGVELVRENYHHAVLEAWDHAAADMSRRDPCGRIVLIEGEPGTGKTFLSRAIMAAATRAMFVIVPPAMVPELSSPTLVQTIIEARDDDRSIVLLLEDADSVLVPRSADNMSAIQSLLNITDGIVGSLLDIRVVATTNARRVEMDSALLRPGRLCRRINVGKLDADHATAVYKRLTGNDLDQVVPSMASELRGRVLSLGRSGPGLTLAEVYRLAVDAEGR